MFKKPTTKTAGDVAVNVLSIGVGVKISDGVSAIMPESTSKWKRYALAILGIGAAACIDAKTPTAKAAQMALVGFGGKQIYDEVQEKLTDAVDPQDSTTTTGKFLNAVIGHKDTPELANSEMQKLAASMDWMSRDNDFEEQPAWLGEPQQEWLAV